MVPGIAGRPSERSETSRPRPPYLYLSLDVKTRTARENWK